MSTRHAVRSMLAAATCTLLLAATAATVAQSAPAAASAAIDDEILGDSLFTAIALTRTQAQLIVSIAREQRAEQIADQPLFMSAVSEIRRARDRGDATTAQRTIEMLQQGANLRRTWWMGAVRAVLTPPQRRQFDANLAALSDEPNVITLAHETRP